MAANKGKKLHHKKKKKFHQKNLNIKNANEPSSTENNKDYDIEASDDEEEVLPKWYDEFPRSKLPKIVTDENDVEMLWNEAESVLEDETKAYKSFLMKTKKSETNWRITVTQSGTISDKIASLVLMIQESPVHNVAALSSLVNMAQTSKNHQFINVLEILTELFITDLLRPNKKLKTFSKQPLSHLTSLCQNDNSLRRKLLCYWLFEDKLKNLYEQFITLLNKAALDTVPSNREKAISSMVKLLIGNREQENLLIANLVNKFGDPVQKLASKVIYGLERVIHKYPKMKVAILDEVERFLFRSNIADKAQYNGLCFLSQYKLSVSDRELCKRLIVLYFAFFKACIKKGNIDSKLMGCLLVGVNRAYPYASHKKHDESIIPVEHIDTMYKIVHYSPFKISLQALSLLLQISNNDRFYNALYKKLFDVELFHTSHQAIWLNLVLKALRKDQNNNRKRAFIKRILLVGMHFPVPLLCSTLIMLSHIIKYLPDFSLNFKFIESKEIKDGTSGIDIISNLKKFENDDEEEHYVDVDIEDDEGASNNLKKNKIETSSVGSSWFHRNLSAVKPIDIGSEKKFKPITEYDPYYRSAAFAGGEKAVFSELTALSRHYHPTVSLFSKKILNGEKINYTGDALKDFTILHFLERFSFKNPKKPKLDRGEDKEELFRAVGSQRSHYNPIGMRALAVQSDEYLNQNESAIPVDELYLYKYLKEKQGKSSKKKDKRDKGDSDSDDEISDSESVGSVEFNEYLDKYMGCKEDVDDVDFASDYHVTQKSKNKSRKRKAENELDDSDDAGDKNEEEADYSDDEVDNDDSDDNDEDNDDYDDDDNEDNNKKKNNHNLDIKYDENDDDKEYDRLDEMNYSDSGDEENENIESDGENEDSEDFEDIENMDITESEEDEEDTKLPFRQALKKRITRDFGNLAVPTERFSEMLEETGRKKTGSSNDWNVKDNASEKQLKWEASRMKKTWNQKKKKNQKQSYKEQNNKQWKNKKFKRNKKY